jgi:WD40 repeat protein
MSPNPDQLKLVKEHARLLPTFCIAWAPESGRAFFGSADFKVYEGDLTAAKFEPKELYAHESYVTGIALADKTLVSGGYDGKLVWWDIEQNKQVRSVEAHTKWIRKVVATRDGKTVASVADDMVCRLWEADSGKMLKELRGHQEKTPHQYPSMLYAVAFSPDGKHLATGDKTGHIVIWDVASGNQIATLEAPVMYTWDPVQRRHSIGGIRAAAFSPDGKWLAVGGIGKIGNIDHLEGKPRLEVFEWGDGKKLLESESDKFKGIINHIEWAPDGAWLLSAGGAADGFLLFFDAKAKKALRQEKSGTHIHAFAFNESADTLVTVGHNKICVYEMKG